MPVVVVGQLLDSRLLVNIRRVFLEVGQVCFGVVSGAVVAQDGVVVANSVSPLAVAHFLSVTLLSVAHLFAPCVVSSLHLYNTRCPVQGQCVILKFNFLFLLTNASVTWHSTMSVKSSRCSAVVIVASMQASSVQMMTVKLFEPLPQLWDKTCSTPWTCRSDLAIAGMLSSGVEVFIVSLSAGRWW